MASQATDARKVDTASRRSIAIASLWLVFLAALSAPSQGGEPVLDAPAAGREAPAASTPSKAPARDAIASLEQRATDLEADGDRTGAARAWLRLAEAALALGRVDAAGRALDRAETLSAPLDEPQMSALTLAARGQVQLARGEIGDARTSLELAEAAARRAGMPQLVATAATNLGRAEARSGDVAAARASWGRAAEAAEAAGDATAVARARANAARLAVEATDGPGVISQVELARAAMVDGVGDRERVELWLHLARTLEQARLLPGVDANAALVTAHGLLIEAESAAARRGDARSMSWALGQLGALYAEDGRPRDALGLTERALAAAEESGDVVAQVRWLSQDGDLLARLGRRDAAIASYARAIEKLEVLRQEVPARRPRDSAAFRDREGRIYYAYVDLLLQRAASRDGRNADGALGAADAELGPQSDLLAAQETLERLKAAELRDYFRDACVDLTLAARISAVDASATAAVVYPILLDDRIELLVSSGAGIERFSSPIARPTVEAEVRRFRRLLERRISRQYLRPAQALHAWLIAPILSHVDALDIDTLVFVLPATLRTVPMAALHDGERFLVERFATALAPGLELTDPRPLDHASLRMLRVGVTESVQDFDALPQVAYEIDSIAELIPGETLLDAEFRASALEEKLENQPFNIVHVASHAAFASDGESSFILTHDGRISMDELAGYVGLFRYRETPLELLVLSACETAAGDDMAALGLSGVAVKAGARSAVGTLWQVSDVAAATLVIDFYTGLREPGTPRAAALATAQREMIAEGEFSHPAYWAPFILISSWL